jgi:hypothetical protein
MYESLHAEMKIALIFMLIYGGIDILMLFGKNITLYFQIKGLVIAVASTIVNPEMTHSVEVKIIIKMVSGNRSSLFSSRFPKTIQLFPLFGFYFSES